MALKMIRTRFAPSPTGDPHIGNIRSALFAYLFAKKNNGQFLLRIEDTDRERHNEGSIAVIKDALKWLGIAPENIDEPMIQSERLKIYKEAALKLVSEDKAYVCNCSKEWLEEVREEQKAKKLPPKYDGHCRDLNLEYMENSVIRMKIPQEGSIKFHDLVRGEVEFPYSSIDDQVILKSDGFPTYHLAHVVDDHEMQISHVIRAEEWLPSTPKHIILNEMLGFDQPEYAHLPVILSPTKGKLSKRDGAVGILEYKFLGYLPEALVNFMVLLGWNPKNDNEIFTLEELEQKFDLTGVNKAPAVFDKEKLNFFNRHYLQKSQPEALIKLLDQEIVQKLPEDKLIKIIEIAKERMNVLSEFKETIAFFLSEPDLDKEKIIFRKSDKETTVIALEITAEKFSQISTWQANIIKGTLDGIVKDNKFSNGDVFWPVRYALSGEEKSPPPEQIAEALTKETATKRIKAALDLLRG
jgi:glutamyl-tRNA synthetase